jgi:hypothetical protein
VNLKAHFTTIKITKNKSSYLCSKLLRVLLNLFEFWNQYTLGLNVGFEPIINFIFVFLTIKTLCSQLFSVKVAHSLRHLCSGKRHVVQRFLPPPVPDRINDR